MSVPASASQSCQCLTPCTTGRLTESTSAPWFQTLHWSAATHHEWRLNSLVRNWNHFKHYQPPSISCSTSPNCSDSHASDAISTNNPSLLMQENFLGPIQMSHLTHSLLLSLDTTLPPSRISLFSNRYLRIPSISLFHPHKTLPHNHQVLTWIKEPQASLKMTTKSSSFPIILTPQSWYKHLCFLVY